MKKLKFSLLKKIILEQKKTNNKIDKSKKEFKENFNKWGTRQKIRKD